MKGPRGSAWAICLCQLAKLCLRRFRVSGCLAERSFFSFMSFSRSKRAEVFWDCSHLYFPTLAALHRVGKISIEVRNSPVTVPAGTLAGQTI